MLTSEGLPERISHVGLPLIYCLPKVKVYCYPHLYSLKQNARFPCEHFSTCQSK